jgi:hypothetical protein
MRNTHTFDAKITQRFARDGLLAAESAVRGPRKSTRSRIRGGIAWARKLPSNKKFLATAKRLRSLFRGGDLFLALALKREITLAPQTAVDDIFVRIVRKYRDRSFTTSRGNRSPVTMGRLKRIHQIIVSNKLVENRSRFRRKKIE